MADRARRAVSGAAALVLASAVLAACGDDGTGQVLAGASGAGLQGEQTFVQLPHGQLALTVTDAGPVDPGDLGSGEEAGDGSYVGVSWAWIPGEGVPDLLSGFLIADDVPATIKVLVGDEWAELGPAYATSAGAPPTTVAYVPASDDLAADDVTLAVDFDGVEQTVAGDGSDREAGVAEPLYDLAFDPLGPACDPRSESAEARVAAECDAAVVELPYVTGLGWSDDGAAWVVVDLTVRAESVVRGGDAEPVIGQTEQITLDGDQPAEVLTEDAVGASLRTQSVFGSAQDAPREVSFTRTLEAGGTVALSGSFSAS